MNENDSQGHLSIQLSFVFDVINTMQKILLVFCLWVLVSSKDGMKAENSTAP